LEFPAVCVSKLKYGARKINFFFHLKYSFCRPLVSGDRGGRITRPFPSAQLRHCLVSAGTQNVFWYAETRSVTASYCFLTTFQYSPRCFLMIVVTHSSFPAIWQKPSLISLLVCLHEHCLSHRQSWISKRNRLWGSRIDACVRASCFCTQFWRHLFAVYVITWNRTGACNFKHCSFLYLKLSEKWTRSYHCCISIMLDFGHCPRYCYISII
jgi:hypothetical protein